MTRTPSFAADTNTLQQKRVYLILDQVKNQLASNTGRNRNPLLFDVEFLQDSLEVSKPNNLRSGA